MSMVGFIVLNYRSIKDVKKCVASIRNLTKMQYKIYIVDNASGDDSVLLLKKNYSLSEDVCVLCSDCNRGYSAGNNIGVKKAISDGVDNLIIINPDVILENDIASIFSDRLNTKKDVGIVVPYITDAKGNFGQIFRKEYTFKRALLERKPFLYLVRLSSDLSVDIDVPDIEKEFEFAGVGSGCCFMISSKLLESINYFDEGQFLYYEEYVLGKKMKDKNLKTLYVPSARVIHNHKNEKTYCTANTNYYRYLSSLYVLKKYEGCSKIKLWLILMENTILLLFRAIYIQEYRGIVKKYIKNASELIKE